MRYFFRPGKPANLKNNVMRYISSIYRISFALLCLGLLPQGVSAQWWKWKVEPDTQKSFVPPNYAPGHIIKTSVLSPFMSFREVRLAYEAPVTERISLQGTLGYYLGYRSGAERLDMGRPNFEAGVEGRYYIPSEKIFGVYTGPMLSANTIHIKEGSTKTRYSPELGGQETYLDMSENIQLRRNDLSAYWNLGIQPIISRRIAVDVNFGLGFRFSKTKMTGYTLPDGLVPEPRNTLTLKPGGIVGFSIGYLLKPCCQLPE